MEEISIQRGWSVETTGQACASVKEIKKLLQQEKFLQGYIYAVLDYAVAFGWYTGDTFQLVFQDEEKEGLVHDLEWACLQEIRIFDAFSEFRAARRGDGKFPWRLRRDYKKKEDAKSSEAAPCCFIEETCKLWGAMQREPNTALPEGKAWHLLASRRGAKIFVSVKGQEGAMVGLKVRNYVAFQIEDALFSQWGSEEKAQSDSSMIRYTDNRLVGFASWPETQNKEKEQEGKNDVERE